MAKKSKNERKVDFSGEVFKILMKDAFDKVDHERFANYFSSLSDEVRAYLLGVSMYEPMIGESVLFGDNKAEGVVTAVHYRELTATIQYKEERRRYFKTAEDSINYMNTGDYDYYNSNSSKNDDYPYIGIHIFNSYTDRSWTELEPDHYSD